MDGSGVVIDGQATIAPAPNDLRDGRFDDPAVAGGPLLSIQRPAATTIERLTFENTNGFAAFNVHAPAGAPIRVKSWSGTFAGPSFESDPVDIVSWTDSEVASVEFTGLAEQVRVRWTTTLEPPTVTGFTVTQALNPAGPFAPIATVTPLGAGTTYEVFDVSLTAGQTYYYQLLEVTASGTVPLGSGQATPYADDLPANVFLVGPNGSFADIQSAVQSATASKSIIMVEPGTYPSFTVGAGAFASLRLMSDGAGPVLIDTTARPVVVQNLPATADIVLADLVIGDPASPNAGLLLSQCDATVLLDGLDVHGGAGRPGVDIAACPHVGVQGCVVGGAPGLRADLGSDIVASRGSLDELELSGGSSASLCELSPGTTIVDPTSQIRSLPGLMPRVLAPRTASLGFDVTATVETQPSQLYVLLLSMDIEWFDARSPVVELIGYLYGPNRMPTVVMGLTDATGQDTLTVEMPANPLLSGLEANLQHITYDVFNGTYRWSEAASVLLLP